MIFLLKLSGRSPEAFFVSVKSVLNECTNYNVNFHISEDGSALELFSTRRYICI